jgi:multidrug efflux system membrane fusion protein
MNPNVNKKQVYTIAYPFLVIVFFSLILAGCGKKKNDKKPPIPNVTMSTVVQMDVPIYIDTIGQVIPPVTVNIRPQINGKLIKAYIEQGAIVKENDILYEIDPRPYLATLYQTLAQLAHDEALLQYAEQAVARNKKVVEEDFISKINYEQYLSNAAAARAQVEQDKAAIAAARLNIEFSKVVAPVSGKISYFNVDVGNILVIDDPTQLTVIRPFSPIDIRFSLPQQQFEMIRRIQGDDGKWQFVATLPEQHENPFDGTTYFIDNQIDQNTGTILLKGRLANAERELWPGEFIRVKVLYKTVPDALTVSPSAVLIGRDGPYVYWIDENGKAVVENVTVLTRNEGYIAIESSNLNPGDRVIADGQINVAPGLTVNDVSINKQ